MRAALCDATVGILMEVLDLFVARCPVLCMCIGLTYNVDKAPLQVSVCSPERSAPRYVSKET